MKKLITVTGSISGFLASASTTLAQITIQQPTGQTTSTAVSLSQLVSRIVQIIITIAIIAVLIFIIYGAFLWITSGGDKEQVGKARTTIINALIGLAVVALAFVIITVVGQILGIENPLTLPFTSLEGTEIQ